MKAPSLSVLLLAFALCHLFTQPTHARIGEDEAALRKRFGDGKTLELSERPAGDHGIWKLFESVMVFEKSGLVITAGLTDGKAEAIAYRLQASEGEPAFLDWAEVATLLAFNVGESSWEKGNFAPITLKRADQGAYAQVVAKMPQSDSYTGVTVVASRLFETIDDFFRGRISTDYVKAHPSRHLIGF